MNLKFILSLSAAATIIMAKNVVNLQDLNAAIGNGKRENVINLQDFMDHVKRYPKNTINLQDLANAIEQEQKSESELSKRDAKNVVYLLDLAQAVKDQQQKRDPKNVVTLQELEQSVKNQQEKRDGIQKRKNVINLNDFKIAVEDEVNGKREAKNVISITDFWTTYNPEENAKRDIDHQVNFKIDEVDCHENILQSILPQIRDISIFSGYIRDNNYISTKTEATDEVTVIIAPTDDAIMNKLNGKKPWEFPLPTDNDKNVEKNSQNFLFGHIIENFEDNLQIEQQTVLTQLLNGNFLTIKQDVSGNFFIKLNDDAWINVKQVKQVDNGFIFVIDDVLVKPN